jgi:predicted RNA-binding Zn-ribbon protein involved in translation (DUF1610 family)
MIKNSLLKIITSVPVILIALYFVPVLGVLLIILKFVTTTNRNTSVATILIITGLIIQIPNLINKLSELFKFKVPYLDKIIEHELYESLTKYSVKLLIIGVVLFILVTVFNKVFSGIKNTLANTMDTYVTKQVEQDREIDEENDSEMKQKQEAAKNFHVIHCPHCGADNIVTDNITRCKYCRKGLQVKE